MIKILSDKNLTDIMRLKIEFLEVNWFDNDKWKSTSNKGPMKSSLSYLLSDYRFSAQF